MYSPLDYLIAKEAMRQIVEYEYGETQFMEALVGAGTADGTGASGNHNGHL
jgi:hypothetical protein